MRPIYLSECGKNQSGNAFAEADRIIHHISWQHQLLQLIDGEKEWAWLREIPAVQILRRFWIQQFYASNPGSPVHWRVAEDLPRSRC